MFDNRWLIIDTMSACFSFTIEFILADDLKMKNLIENNFYWRWRWAPGAGKLTDEGWSVRDATIERDRWRETETEGAQREREKDDNKCTQSIKFSRRRVSLGSTIQCLLLVTHLCFTHLLSSSSLLSSSLSSSFDDNHHHFYYLVADQLLNRLWVSQRWMRMKNKFYSFFSSEKWIRNLSSKNSHE